MAPELFEGPASRSSDIYALGIVLYTMLTGRLPFSGPNPLAIAAKQLHEPPIPPSRFNPSIAPSIEEVVLGALEKDPQRRFQSAHAFANAYHHVLQISGELAGHPGGAPSSFHADPTMAIRSVSFTPPELRPTSSGQSKRTSRTLWLILSGLFVLLLVLGGFLLARVGPENHAVGQLFASTTTTTLTPTATLARTATQSTVTCAVNDSANILDKNQVCQEAQSLLSYSLVVNTSNASGGGNNSTSSIDANTIVITIVVNQSHHEHDQQVQVTITGGNAVPLTDEQYHSAVDAFNRAVHSGDYTAATVAAIQSLQASGA
jgi:serine/threonine protein kinase